MVLQDPLSSLNPVLTIGEQIGEGIRIHDHLQGAPLRQRVVDMMHAVDIPAPDSRLRDYPHQYSGGMRQRVVGAVALACRPRFLIADEPTTSLDVTIQMQYLNLLKEIQQREKLAMLFVTHDLGVVAKMCDRVAVMYAGKIVEIGDVRQIFDNPKHPYTKALLRSVPKTTDRAERLYSIEGQPPVMLGLPPQCSFLPRCPVSFERCQAPEFPPSVEVEPNHCARCWHYV
jgi:oligopeptide/dipeptide ABC transporter ATP-binding protein